MIILASASPRRREILKKHGINPEIIKPETNETIRSGFPYYLSAEQTVMYTALKKGQAVYRRLTHDKRIDADHIISADTVVYDGKIIGKPQDDDEAVKILHSLKNKKHYVLTGVALTCPDTGYSQILYDISKVYFRNYTDHEIKAYIKKESPLDKAGAYAIQGAWGKQVEKIEGDRENIIGLPWHLIKPLLFR